MSKDTWTMHYFLFHVTIGTILQQDKDNTTLANQDCAIKQGAEKGNIADLRPKMHQFMWSSMGFS